jgi:hypothetical protein
LSPVQTAVKGIAYVAARQPEVDVVLIVGDGVLNTREPEDGQKAG